MAKPLRGLRVAVLAADGFEQVEVTVPRAALRQAGADVRIISLRPGRIRGVNLLWRGRKLPVDDLVSNAGPEDYGALLLPGGLVSPDLLRQSERAKEFVRRMEALGRPIATLCHGPWVLVSAGLASGRHLTSWPGIADDVRNAGAHWTDAPLVRDGRWISSRGPHDLHRFVPAMIELFAREGVRDLEVLPRRWHWAAHVSRLATFGLAPALAFGVARRLARGERRRLARQMAYPVLRDVGGVAAFGVALLGLNAIAIRALSRRRRELDGATADRALHAPTGAPVAAGTPTSTA
jgi:protease I